MEKLLIIDSNSLINRSYYGVRYLSAPDGTPTNAVYGFLMTFLKLVEENKPDYIMAAFDLKEPTFRHKMYKGYKAQRKPMPDELAEQMPIVKAILSDMKIAQLSLAGYEADDIIGTVSRECAKRDIKCLIATGDKDDLQLADRYTSILLTTTRVGVTHTEEYTPERVFERYGVTPEEFIDVKALMGDPSDNIPGVAGIGEKTATTLIAKYKSIENIYENFDKNGFTGAQERKLREGKEMAFLSKTLARIDTNVPIEMDFEAARGGIETNGDLYRRLLLLGLNSIIKRLDFSSESDSEADSPIADCTKTIIDDIAALEELCLRIRERKRVSLMFGYNDGKIVRVGAALDKDGYSIEIGAIGRAAALDAMRDILESEEIEKICFQAKDAIVCLAPEIRFKGLKYDIAIASYLINPARAEYTVSAICLESFGVTPFHGEEKRQISMFDDDEDSASDRLMSEALLLEPLYEDTSEKMKKEGQEELYYNVELPLVEVLADMQREGMYIDREKLHEFGKTLGERVERLKQEIYTLAGGEFNINSPKRLGEILSEKFKVPLKKKTKNGYATGAEILEKLRDEYPVVDKILDFRQCSKLKSTYCDGLEAVISKETGRIHSIFNQTVTLTGRISSADPNMQNIPTRTELGREIRKMFVARDGWIFVDADYSQIELRVLAAMSKDVQMIMAFCSGADIHTETASQVLHIPKMLVSKEQRAGAKIVNFGIVYGMSDYSLAQDLKITVKEAREYIDKYFEHYSGIKNYMETLKEDAKKNGYVKTMMNRIRYIPELKSSSYNIRMFGERAAMNTPIQGTAADIIKLAMVRVHQRLADEGLRAKLVLQVHDELIVEAPPEEEEKVRDILREVMENVVKIGVPLTVDIESGRSWYDCK